jgi:hypothetical protein
MNANLSLPQKLNMKARDQVTKSPSKLPHILRMFVWDYDFDSLSWEQPSSRYPGSVPFSMKAERTGLTTHFRVTAPQPVPFLPPRALGCAPTIKTSPAAMASFTEDYAAASADDAGRRCRKKSTPARS